MMGGAKMTLDQVAGTSILTACHEDVTGGSYWAMEKPGKESPTVKDTKVQELLWEHTKKLISWQ